METATQNHTQVFGHEYPVMLDTETDNLEAKHDSSVRLNLVGLKFLRDYGDFKAGQHYTFTEQEFRETHKALDSVVTWVIHNASFDVPVLRVRGIKLTNYFCTMVASHTFNPSLESYSLGELTGMKMNMKTPIRLL